VGYVEAHGTGTEAGDAAEMASISSIFSRDDGSSVFVGSIKANIGHSEPTSGLAGLIKAVLVVEKGLIPPVPGIENLKESLDIGSGVKVPLNLHGLSYPGC
jgi:acyl transferase domain-containing protein